MAEESQIVIVMWSRQTTKAIPVGLLGDDSTLLSSQHKSTHRIFVYISIKRTSVFIHRTSVDWGNNARNIELESAMTVRAPGTRLDLAPPIGSNEMGELCGVAFSYSRVAD